jgi:hypothetical protein
VERAAENHLASPETWIRLLPQTAAAFFQVLGEAMRTVELVVPEVGNRARACVAG